MTPTEFRKLNLAGRYAAVKKDGIHLASREFNAYFVHLFSFHNLYVEVWVLIGINQIRWIEVQENQSQIDLYVEKFDLGALFA